MAFARQVCAVSKRIFSLSTSTSMASHALKMNIFSRNITTSQIFRDKKEVNITFVKTDGEKVKVKAKVGATLYDIAKENKLIEPVSWCNGCGFCHVCHMIFTEEDYEKLPPLSSCEFSYVWLCYKSCDTSRFGCRLSVTKDLHDTEIMLTPPEPWVYPAVEE